MSREVVVFVEDIFYTAKIRESARTVARDVRFVRDAGALERRLDGPAPGMVIMEFSSLSRAELMQEANQLGAEVVLPKTSFTQQLPEILQAAPA
jgi:hypothetical protein